MIYGREFIASQPKGMASMASTLRLKGTLREAIPFHFQEAYNGDQIERDPS